MSYAPGVYTDGEGTVKTVHSDAEVQCKRRYIDIASLREAVALGDIRYLRHLKGTLQPADPLTKIKPITSSEFQILDRLLYQGVAPQKA